MMLMLGCPNGSSGSGLYEQPTGLEGGFGKSGAVLEIFGKSETIFHTLSARKGGCNVAKHRTVGLSLALGSDPLCASSARFDLSLLNLATRSRHWVNENFLPIFEIVHHYKCSESMPTLIISRRIQPDNQPRRDLESSSVPKPVSCKQGPSVDAAVNANVSAASKTEARSTSEDFSTSDDSTGNSVGATTERQGLKEVLAIGDLGEVLFDSNFEEEVHQNGYAYKLAKQRAEASKSDTGTFSVEVFAFNCIVSIDCFIP